MKQNQKAKQGARKPNKYARLNKKQIVQHLKNRSYSNSEERTMLLECLKNFSDITINDISWMMFVPDPLVRKTAEELIKKIEDPNTLDILLQEMRGKPQSAKRSFLRVLPTLKVPNLADKAQTMLRDKDPEVREIATRMLLELPMNRANLPTFQKLVLHAPLDIRLRALERLREVGKYAVFMSAKTLVNDEKEKIRKKAYEILIETKDTRYLKLFLEKIVGETPGNRELLSGAIAGLSEGMGEQLLDDVLSLLSSGNDVLRQTVLSILIKMPNRKAVIRHFIEYSRSLLGWVRTRALNSMKEFGEDLIEPLIGLMEDPDDDIRATALMVAGNFKDSRIVPKAVKALNDKDWWIRVGAAEVLGNIGDKSAVPHLVKALADPEVCWSALDALGKIQDPRSLDAIIQLTRSKQAEIRVEAMNALQHFPSKKAIQALTHIARTDPIKNIKFRALEMMKSMAQTAKVDIGDTTKFEQSLSVAGKVEGEPRIHFYLNAARQKKASDFHLAVGSPPLLRIDGKLIKVKGDDVTPQLSEAMFKEILTDEQLQKLKKEKQLDFCYYLPNSGRFRANIFLDHKGYSGVFRTIPDKPPSLSDIGIPGHLHKITHYHQGLIVVCGPSGSGKSTTLAALVNLMNESKRDHIITLEDPIEFVHPFKNSLINQRAVGEHTESFDAALRAALREDPDVIVIGEMRDSDTASLAMTAAETGHVVFCTMNTTTAHKAIDRLISYYPSEEQPQVRMALSETLKAVIAQMLLPKVDGTGRLAVFEIILGTSALSNLIRDDKTYQIPSLLQISRKIGMQSFDQAMMTYVEENVISAEDAYIRALKKEQFEPLVSQEFLEELSSY